MSIIKKTLFVLSILGFVGVAQARDTTVMVDIASAMNSPEYRERLGDDVRFRFGNTRYANPRADRGTFVSNRKTNAFGKSDQEACRWVLLSALLSLKERAINEGGNAVVDIISFYKRNEYSSTTQVECHAGAFVAGIALQGRVVVLP